MFDNTVLNIINRYKYRGTILNQHLDVSVTSSVLSGGPDLALGAVISTFKQLKKCGI